MPAPSGYLGYTNQHTSNEMMQEICVPYAAPCTFYSLLNWNAGQNDEMAGYAGLQCLPNGGKTFHFSIWDPETTEKKPACLELIPNASQQRFGDEKEGIKIVFPFPYEYNAWYRLRIKIEHPNDVSTNITSYLCEAENGEELLISTISFPLPNKTFISGYSSFIEDFCNSPNRQRKYYTRNGKSFDLRTQQWHNWSEQSFSFNESDENKAINAGVEGHSFFLEAGGNTVLEIPNHTVLSILP